ncbi:MAG: hypothetical protein HY393_00300 [Candidatus Diapherotrites archaeon]|nr:hypothetical protein [Candidatus Diapherotrites archaeon]
MRALKVFGVLFLAALLVLPSVLAQADSKGTVPFFSHGFQGLLENADESPLPFELFWLELKENGAQAEKLFLGVGSVRGALANAAYLYYPIQDPQAVPPVKQAWGQLFDSSGTLYAEADLFFDEQGKVDFSKSFVGLVPEEYKAGRMETILKPKDSLTGLLEFESVEVKRSNICFDYGQDPHASTGLCPLYAFSDVESLNELNPSILERLSSEPGKEKETPLPLTPEQSNELFPPLGEVKPPTPENVAGSLPLPWGDKKSPAPLTVPSANVKGVAPPFSWDVHSSTVFFSAPFFFDNFSGGFPTGSWSAGDLDGGNNSDYWDDTSYRYYSGPYSIWSAQVGTQTQPSSSNQKFFLTFEGGFPSGWKAEDLDGGSGLDYWGVSSAKPYNGTKSLYVAENSNVAGQAYDNLMNAWFYEQFYYDATTWSNVVLSFKVWYSMESGYDNLYVYIYSPTGWQQVASYTGSSGGWSTKTINIPSSFLSSQFAVGFRFVSDDSFTGEGVYLDDVSLSYDASTTYNNSTLHQYDDFMQSYAKIPFTMSGSETARIEYAYWLDVEDGFDGLKVEWSNDGSSWSSLKTYSTGYDSKDGDALAKAWLYDNPVVPQSFAGNTLYFRFLFYSDDSIHDREGAYVDDVYISGLLPDGAFCASALECTSNVCGGAHNEYYIHCNTDGSGTVYANIDSYVNACGGNGTYSSTNYDGQSGSCSAGTVCDADLAYWTSSFTTSQICKKSQYSNCSSSSECWNDNDGIDCMGSTGNKICTYGNNGNQCFNNDDLQCDSGRCDSGTCQAKQPDGSSCDEPSDCTANACTAGICGTGTPNGGSCTKDVECQSKVCVYYSSTQGTCQASTDPFLSNEDSWNSSASNGQSSNTDGIAFAGYSVYPYITGLKESTDMVCHDFDGDGQYDWCYYDTDGCGGSGCNVSSCNYFSVPSNISSSNKQACNIDTGIGCAIGLDGGTSAQICGSGSCSVSTNNPKQKDSDAMAFYDCDNSDGLRSSQTLSENGGYDDYWIVSPKYYVCSSQSAPNPNYMLGGYYGTGELFWQSYACSSGKSCDITQDDQNVYTGTQSIPDACRKNPGQSCSSSSDCLYGVCEGNVCASGFIVDGSMYDEFDKAIPNMTMKLTKCDGTVVQSTPTDAQGNFVFKAKTGQYKIKAVATWGEPEYVDVTGNACLNYGEGFVYLPLFVYTKTTLHGKAVEPSGTPSQNLPFELYSCQESILTSANTDSQGDFSLTSDAGDHVLKVNVNNVKIPLTDYEGNACFFDAGDIDLGTLEITNNCPAYNNTCDGTIRYYNCKSDSKYGCSCSYEVCSNGCTEGAPACNPVNTGTLIAKVSGAGEPVESVSIFVDGTLKGMTNFKGEKQVNVQYGVHEVKAACAFGGLNAKKTLNVNQPLNYAAFELNCPLQDKADIKVDVNNSAGYPIANVAVWLDGLAVEEKTVYTNAFGVAFVENVSLGSHSVTLAFKTSDSDPGSQLTKQIVVDEDVEVFQQTILLPTEPGYTGYQSLEASPQFLPLVVIAFIALDVAFKAWDAYDYCDCVYDYSGDVSQCAVDLIACNPTDSQAVYGKSSCSDVLKLHAQKTASTCTWEAGFLATDFIPLASIINKPVKIIGKAAKLVKNSDKIADTGKLVTSAGELLATSGKGKKIVETLAGGSKKLLDDDGFTYISKQVTDSTGKKVWKEVIDVGVDVAKLSDNGIKAAETLAKKLPGGDKAFKDLIGKKLGSFTFSEDVMAKVFNSVGELEAKGLPASELKKLQDKIVHDLDIVKSGNYEVAGTLTTFKGTSGEAIAGGAQKFSSNLKLFDVPNPPSQIDWVLNNDEMLQIKYVDILAYKADPTKPFLYLAELKSYAKQLVTTHNFNKNVNVHLVFIDGATDTLEKAIKADLKAAIDKVDKTFDLQKLVIEGLD